MNQNIRRSVFKICMNIPVGISQNSQTFFIQKRISDNVLLLSFCFEMLCAVYLDHNFSDAI